MSYVPTPVELAAIEPALTRLARQLDELGPRPSGTPAIGAARALVTDQLRCTGAQQLAEWPFETFRWIPGNSALLDAAGARFEAIDCLPCPAATATGTIVDLRGKPPGPLEEPVIGILNSDVLQSPAAWAWHEHGLLGALCPGGEPPHLPRLVYLYRAPGYPVLGIGQQLAEEFARRAPVVTMTTGGLGVPATDASLDATLGPDHAEYIVLSAHLDTHHVSPGIFDNYSGIAALLGVAMLLAPRQASFRRRLRLLIFSGEEYSWAGSRAFVHQTGDLDYCLLDLNFDSLCPTTARALAVMDSPPLTILLRQAAETLGLPLEVRDFFCHGSDYLPFVLAGIPAARPADFERMLPPWTHLREDTFAHWDWPPVAANIATYAPLLEHLLTVDSLPPLPHRSATAVEATFTAAGVRDLLEYRL